MDIALIRGFLATVVLVNGFMLINSLPTPQLRSSHGQTENANRAVTFRGNRRGLMPAEFQKYIELFELNERLNELKREINGRPLGDEDIDSTAEENVIAKLKQHVIKLHGRQNDISKASKSVSKSVETPFVHEGNVPSLAINEDGAMVETETELHSTNANHEVAGDIGNSLNKAGNPYDFSAAPIARRRRDVQNLDLSNICTTDECVKQLMQYLDWRQKNGYPVYTGVWKVGK